MAAGSPLNVHSSVLNGAYLTIQAGSGATWEISNIYCGGAWELYRTDGTNTILVTNGTQAGGLLKLNLVADNTYYYKVKNVSGGTVYFGYDGVVWE